MLNSIKNFFKKKQHGNTYPTFWFMRDNHTFIKLKGKDIHAIKQDAIQVSKNNTYGMVCPVTILQDGKELKRVGECCHVDGNGHVDLEKWWKEIRKEKCVRLYKGEK